MIVLVGGCIASSTSTNIHQQERVGTPEAPKHEESAAGPGVTNDEAEHTNNDLDEPCSGEESTQKHVRGVHGTCVQLD
ncbi:UNVERIFIED_CONTAM: hypothetical protein ACS92_03445 [Bacillus cereus]